MNLKTCFCYLLLIIFAIESCKKNNDVAVANSDIYIAGVTGLNSSDVATYWKNGEPVYIGNGAANAIVVSGSDIYVAGYSNRSNGDPIATYWKNGVATYLPGVSGIAYGIAIKDDNVYVVGTTEGSEHLEATYWKNGIPTKLKGGSDFYSSKANAIIVNGIDVYIAGCTADANDNYIATYWKNGIATYLPGYTSPVGANAIAVKDNDIYIVGSIAETDRSNGDWLIDTRATYWKNGVVTKLTDSTTYSGASSIVVNDNDVYIAGFTKDVSGYLIPTYWKNGVDTKLSFTPSMYSKYSVAAIAVQGNDVYVTGGTDGYLGYWKNNKSVQLKGNIERLSGIVVVPH